MIAFKCSVMYNSSTHRPFSISTQINYPFKHIIYKSDRVFSIPQGSSNKFVSPALFSHVSRPETGPALGFLEASEAMALSLSELRRETVVSGVRSS